VSQVDNHLNNPDLQSIDSALASIFTDTGIVRGASSARTQFQRGGLGSHYTFPDGQLHTIHIYGNESASSFAGVYIPKEFSDVTITSNDTVVAKNRKTGEVILIAHVQVGSRAKGSKTNKILSENMKTVRENGTIYIGQIGGKGGAANTDGRGIHSHLVYFPSESARLKATEYKRNSGPVGGEFETPISKYLSDFRNIVKK
jgi:hypothetical protein